MRPFGRWKVGISMIGGVRDGYSLVYAPNAVIHHRHELTLAGFWRQHFGCARGAYRFIARARRGAGLFSH